MRKRPYPFDVDVRYDYPESRFEENYRNRRSSWHDTDVRNGTSGIPTSIDYHHGLSADVPQQRQVC